MASVNKWIGIGNLGRDPETRYAPNGDAICNISIACTDSYKDKASGEKKEVTEWVRVVFFGKLAEIAGQYLQKGSQVYVEGSLRTRKWQNKDSQDQYTTEVRADVMKMLGSKPESGENRSQGASQAQQRQQAAAPRHQPPKQQGGGYDYEDVPFANIGRGMASHVI